MADIGNEGDEGLMRKIVAGETDISAALAVTDARAGLGQAAGGPEFGPLGERLGYFLRRAQIAVFDDFHRHFAPFEIRPAQYSMLTIIEHNPGLSQTELANALGIKKTNLVAMVDALQRRKLLRREARPQDRRSYALYLTAQGQALIAELHRVAVEQERRIMALVGEGTHRELFLTLRKIARL